MAVSQDHLFVYGTLRTSSSHPMADMLRAHATRLGSGHIQARLYLITEEDAHGINRYPGAVPSPDPSDRVHGEVYHVSNPAPLYTALDAFEACSPGWPEPYEFLLRPIDVALDTGETLRAVSYLYTWDTARAQWLPDGRYRQAEGTVR